MADSIPSLRRKLAEANLRIAELEAAQPVERIVERRVEVPGPNVVEVKTERVEVPVDRIRVVTQPVEVQGPERIVVVKEYVDVPTVKEVYVTDPILEETIRNLQEQLRCISQSDS